MTINTTVEFIYLGSKKKTSREKGNTYLEVNGMQNGELVRFYYPTTIDLDVKEMSKVSADLEITTSQKFTNIKIVSLDVIA